MDNSGGLNNTEVKGTIKHHAGPFHAPKEDTKTTEDSFYRVILTDWFTYPGIGETPKSEILEFAWAVYDVASECVLEKVRHILRPTENDRTDISADILKSLKLVDCRPLENAKTLKQVLTEFDAACSMVAPPSVCVVLGSTKLRDQLLTETFRKALAVPNCLKGVLDLSTLAAHFYPNEFSNGPDNSSLSPNVIAKNIDATIPPHPEEFISMDGCILMSQIIKKMSLDSIKFQPQHLSTVITAPTQQDTNNTTITTTTGKGPVEYIVRMRGVPWDVSDADIIKFVEPVCSITSADVHISTNYEGRATGEVHVRLPSMQARDSCLAVLHGQHLGRRWIEIFKASEGEFNTFAAIKENQQLDRRGALRMRGLPYSTNEYEVVKFFQEADFNIDINSVVLGQSRENRLSGDAWILLESPQIAEDARRALHKKSIGRRYIELFQSSPREVEMARRGHLPPPRMGYDRPSPYGHHSWGGPPLRYGMGPPPTVLSYHHGGRPPMRGDRGGGGHSTILRLRGLPFYANEKQIVEFFRGFGMAAILPATAPIDGRPSGEAYVEFVTVDEAWRAMKSMQGGMIDRRYIELFSSTKQEMEFAAAGMDPREIRSRCPRN